MPRDARTPVPPDTQPQEDERMDTVGTPILVNTAALDHPPALPADIDDLPSLATQPMPPPVANPPTLDAAFLATCQALAAHVPWTAAAIKERAIALVDIYADGNRLFAWREVFKLLETAATIGPL